MTQQKQFYIIAQYSVQQVLLTLSDLQVQLILTHFRPRPLSDPANIDPLLDPDKTDPFQTQPTSNTLCQIQTHFRPRIISDPEPFQIQNHSDKDNFDPFLLLTILTYFRSLSISEPTIIDPFQTYLPSHTLYMCLLFNQVNDDPWQRHSQHMNKSRSVTEHTIIQIYSVQSLRQILCLNSSIIHISIRQLKPP